MQRMKRIVWKSWVLVNVQVAGGNGGELDDFYNHSQNFSTCSICKTKPDGRVININWESGLKTTGIQ